MEAFIDPPRRFPLFLRLGIWISKRVTGKELPVAKLLAWYPKSAIGSGVLESLVAHRDKDISTRLLRLVRMQASFSVSCPFCIDMNSLEFENNDRFMNISHVGIYARDGKVVDASSSRGQVVYCTILYDYFILAVFHIRLLTRICEKCTE